MTHHPDYSIPLHPAVECLLENDFDGMAQMMALLLVEAMKIERSLAPGANPYKRTDGRLGYANGFKPKTVTTLSSHVKGILKIPTTLT